MKKSMTILHANDLHGQLQFTLRDDFELHGGISLTSGYIKKVREESDGCFFGICGDVLQEDILGSDYKGTNTVSLLNYVKPDAISLGNHEMDYGFAHLLTFKSCIEVPTLCANIIVGHLNQNLFSPSMVYETNGIRMLLIGVIPEDFLRKIMTDEFCRSMIEYRDSYDAIRIEIEKHKREHIDLVVLMSHYGIDGDRVLASEMPDDINVDIILGGHTHINMDKAEVVNDIVIAQSSYGTTHIGRFDLVVDTDKKKLESWKWERVELTEDVADFDYGIDELADKIVFQKKKKRASDVLGEMEKTYEQRNRLLESDLGNIISDAFLELYKPDLVILQSGSIRLKECGPKITEKALMQLYPFDDRFMIVNLSGKEIKDAFKYLFMLKPDGTVMNGTFQYSKGFRLEVDGEYCWTKGCSILSLTLNGEEFADDKVYRVGLTKNFVTNFFRYFGMVIDEDRMKLASLSTYNDLAKWIIDHDGPIVAPPKGRFIINNFEWDA